MFVVIVYDVRADRTQNICDYLRRWLNWRQNSVFDGHITASEYDEIRSWIQSFIHAGEQVLVYSTTREDALEIEEIGDERANTRFL